MNKADIGGLVAARLGLRKAEAEAAVDTVFEAIGDSLASGEDVRIAGFGTFGTRSRTARTGRNPRTGESLNIAASTGTDVQARQAVEGCRERGERVVDPARPESDRRSRFRSRVAKRDGMPGRRPVSQSVEVLRGAAQADRGVTSEDVG